MCSTILGKNLLKERATKITTGNHQFDDLIIEWCSIYLLLILTHVKILSVVKFVVSMKFETKSNLEMIALIKLRRKINTKTIAKLSELNKYKDQSKKYTRGI